MKGNLEVNKFLNSLEVEIGEPHTHYSITLKGFSAISKYLETELQVWAHIKQPISSITKCRETLTKLKQAVSRIGDISNTNLTQASQEWVAVKAHIGVVPNSQYRSQWFFIPSRSPLGQFVVSVVTDTPSLVDSVLRYFYFPNEVQFRSRDELVGWLMAYEFDKQDPERAKRSTSEKRSLSQIRNHWENLLSETQAIFDALQLDHEEWKTTYKKEHEVWDSNEKQRFNELFSDSKAKIEELQNLYTEQLQLKGPTELWKKRTEQYKKNAQWSVIGLIVVVLLSVLILGGILYWTPEAFHHSLLKLEPEAVKAVVVFATVISFLAYLARIFAKLAFSSFHLQRDSEEREQLTMVYLALLEGDAMTKEDRELILQSLFSRVDTGLLGDDGAPTMPGIGSILEKR